MPSLTPDTCVATPLIRQRWQSVSFVHWRYRASDVRGLVPAAFELDTFEGDAWVSVVAFLTSFAVGGVVPLPGRRIYPQTNVRTYVRAPDGTDGLWFLCDTGLSGEFLPERTSSSVDSAFPMDGVRWPSTAGTGS